MIETLPCFDPWDVSVAAVAAGSPLPSSSISSSDSVPESSSLEHGGGGGGGAASRVTPCWKEGMKLNGLILHNILLFCAGFIKYRHPYMTMLKFVNVNNFKQAVI